ncbi:hypothetical protein EXIGLDRAFT_181007 [Exidia glandulosa HHB12029]|uniref:Uncharacterized protein n=1 Tax=Exidia glandulosa HHB12029 TaxID=1314781 RepID=A0A165F2I4_EXIGL|nr:hypothetical protein EXIGLDRAFT_181007 [Exidia glandulosa HHB12029]
MISPLFARGWRYALLQLSQCQTYCTTMCCTGTRAIAGSPKHPPRTELSLSLAVATLLIATPSRSALPRRALKADLLHEFESYRRVCTGFTIVSAVTLQMSPLQGLRPRSQCVLSATTFILPPVRPKQTGMPSIPFSHAGRGFPLLNRPTSRSVLPKNSTVPDLPALRTPRRAGRVFRRRAQLEASIAG